MLAFYQTRQLSAIPNKVYLIGALQLYKQSYSDSAKQRLAETTISARIFDDLNFADHVKGLVIIEGEQRTGKSTAAETWCAMHPGQAIYIPLESGKDIFTFFRSIARAIGTASSGQMKANEMRMRIEDMLQEKHLTVVIDEAHYLFPLVARPKSAPDRVDWVRTALVDHGVAVALVATPQFDRQCAHFEKCIKWNAKQIKGRIKLQTLLPSELPVEDLTAVARKMAPHADENSVRRLVGYAQVSDDYLAGIERLTCRAGFFAAKEGRLESSAGDIKRALDEAMPTLQQTTPAPVKPTRKRGGSIRVLPSRVVPTVLERERTPVDSRRVSMDPPTPRGGGLEALGRLQFNEAAASG